PVMIRGQFLGVIEFFTRKAVRPDAELLRMLAAIGSQVGQFIERKQMEAERAGLLASEREARSEAEMANRLKDEFLATVSHELRTPLNAILGWTRLMRAGMLDEAKKVQALEVLERNARAHQHIIEDILDASRIITGKLRLDLSPVEIGPIVQQAATSMKL